ncbi:MAG: glycosyltransferase family 39 protein [Chloroflexi bacterium]|nr:glycosyltransferase family 39 protein [Chloroflexota bacterium]
MTAVWSAIRGRSVAFALTGVLILALGLRLYGLDWDQGGLFHPDERAILMYVERLEAPGPSDIGKLTSAEESPWNPRWFNYGSLPLYLLKTVEIAVSPVADMDIFDMRIPGRVISALADTAVVGLVFVMARSWYGTRTAVLAALLSALAVIGIQLSHFYAVDTLLTLFVTASVFFATRVARRGRASDAALAGLFAGLAIATKFSAVVLAVPLLAAFAVYAFSGPGEALEPGAPEAARERRRRAVRGIVIAAAVALAAVFVTQPYMFLDFRTFIAHTAEQSKMVRRLVDLPYTRQYIDTPRWYQVWQLATWGLGPVLGTLVWAGFAWAFVHVYRTRRKTELVVLAWLVPYVAITLWFEVKFMRYMLPAVPFMIVFGARLVWNVAGWVQGRLSPRAGKWAVAALLAAVLVPTAHYALAYASIYTRPHPAQSASDWLTAHAGPGDIVLKEHWEEGIPELARFRSQELELYNPDSQAKFERIAEQLALADYLVLYSNRLYATLSRLPERYPASRAYYERLFAGDLGYELVYSAESIPAFAGIAYEDDYFGRGGLEAPVGYEHSSGRVATVGFGWADESFTVYVHPRTLIFKYVGGDSESELAKILVQAAPSTASLGLMLTEEERGAQIAGGTYASIVQLDGSANRWSWIVWLLAMEVIGLAVTPIALFVFRPLAGRGYLLAKLLGLLLVALLAWLLASFDLAGFSRLSVVLSIVAVAVVSGILWVRNAGEVRNFIRRNWRKALPLEALFIAAFVSFLLIRVANPDLWHPFRGGEKPMDFAYLNAVARSTIMPPYDPWFGGGYLNYYYFGQFVVASLIRLTGIAPSVAYNLAVPALFALTVGAAFTVVYALAEGTRRARGLAGPSRGPVYAGIAAAVLVAVAGNVDGLVQLVEGAWGSLSQGDPFPPFDYWRSSRMMAPDSPGNEITEFPFFTFLFADLHAHLIAIPFTLLAVGLAITVFLGAWERGRGRAAEWLAIALLGIAVGVLRVINAWDFPTYLVLAAAAAFFGEVLAGRGQLWRSFAIGIVKTIAVAAIGYVVFLPFHLRFELFNDGIEASKTQTPLWRYLAVHGPFLAVIVSYLVWEAKSAIGEAVRRTGLRPEYLALYVAVPAALFAAVAVFGYATLVFTLGLVLLTATLAFLKYRAEDANSRYFVILAAMLSIAFAIGAAVDVVSVKNDIGRMNTVFNFYLQAWVLFGLATAYILWRLGSAGWLSLKGAPARRVAWLAAIAVLFTATFVYPVLGTRARIADRFDTSFTGVDGMAYMNGTTYREPNAEIDFKYDLDAIRWLQENVKGSPVVLEGLTELYRWGNRVSVYTGLPSVVGWDWHQRQQRVEYSWAVTQRRGDVNRIFTTTDERAALELMREYDVRYVFVGELERQYYPAAGIAKFDRMRDDGLAPVYSNDRVTIYELAPTTSGTIRP